MIAPKSNSTWMLHLHEIFIQFKKYIYIVFVSGNFWNVKCFVPANTKMWPSRTLLAVVALWMSRTTLSRNLKALRISKLFLFANLVIRSNPVPSRKSNNSGTFLITLICCWEMWHWNQNEFKVSSEKGWKNIKMVWVYCIHVWTN